MKNPWKTLSSKIVYKTSWFKVREDKVITPGGDKSTYSFVDKKFASVICPITSNGKIYLVRQFRYPIKKFSWELPTGANDKKENPLNCAKRELREETGLCAKRWKRIGFMYDANGFADEILYIFLARDLSESKNDLETTEKDILVKRFSIKKVKNMIKENKIFDSISIVAFYKVLEYLKKKI